jgi:hypothetical protein
MFDATCIASPCSAYLFVNIPFHECAFVLTSPKGRKRANKTEKSMNFQLSTVTLNSFQDPYLHEGMDAEMNSA